MNYSYRKFLSIARPFLKQTLQEAEDIIKSLSMSMEYDENFPWHDDFRTAVGRCCSHVENANFVISIHLKAIYHAIRENMDELWFFPEDYQWENEIEKAIKETIYHEIGHGIYETAADYSFEDDDFWSWCIEKGFDKSLFPECLPADEVRELEESLCEDYCRNRNDSQLGLFIEEYQKL